MIVDRIWVIIGIIEQRVPRPLLSSFNQHTINDEVARVEVVVLVVYCQQATSTIYQYIEEYYSILLYASAVSSDMKTQPQYIQQYSGFVYFLFFLFLSLSLSSPSLSFLFCHLALCADEEMLILLLQATSTRGPNNISLV